MNQATIQHVTFYRYRIPLIRSLSIAGSVLSERAGLLVKLEDSTGKTGWGDAAPLPGLSSETMEEVLETCQPLKDQLMGQVPSERISLPANLPPSTAWAVDTAIMDLQAKHKAPCIQLNALIWQLPDAWAVEGTALVKNSYNAIKVKVGNGDPLENARALIHLRQVIGPSIQLRLDVNRKWSIEQAISFGNACQLANVTYVEEPTENPDEFYRFYEETGIRVALDESVLNLDLVSRLISSPSVCGLILKPTLLGGTAQLLPYINMARKHGKDVVLSSCFESGVGVRGLARLAIQFGLEHRPMGFDPYRWLQQDILKEPLSIREGGLVFPDGLSQPAQVHVESLTSL